MAHNNNSLIILVSLFFVIVSNGHPSFRPRAIVLKVTKDTLTSQYLTTIPQGTPKFPARLTLDLGGDFTWLDCKSAFNSSTQPLIPCRSAQCSLAGSNFCLSGVCDLSAFNSVVRFISNGDLSADSAKFHSLSGNKTEVVVIRSLLFACTRTFLREGLIVDSIGIAALGRIKVSLPSLLSAAFSFPRRFSVCLSPAAASGFVLIGDEDENEKLQAVSKTLTYTPIDYVSEDYGFIDDLKLIREIQTKE